MKMVLCNLLSLVALISPPFLLVYAWKRLLERREPLPPLWKRIIGWIGVLVVSCIFISCVFVLLTQNCRLDMGDWSCVARWRTFSGYIVEITPIAILLACFGRRGTRIVSALAALAIAYDCILYDMLP
jgi:hypothetical protein